MEKLVDNSGDIVETVSYSTFGVYVTDALLLGEEDEGYNGDIYLTNTDLPFSTQND